MRLVACNKEFGQIEENLNVALELASDCLEAYRQASPTVRRLFNQAFFTQLLIDDDGEVRTELAT